jgi:hypothetical protein
MSALEKRSNHLLRLAIKNFERAECADAPAVAAQFRVTGAFSVRQLSQRTWALFKTRTLSTSPSGVCVMK